MTKLKLSVLVAISAMVVSASACTKKNGGASSSAKSDSVKDTVADIQVQEQEEDTRLMVMSFNAELGESKLVLQYPGSGPALLVDSVRNWENGLLAASFETPGGYKGDMNDGKAFFDFYKSKMHFYNEEWMEYQVDEIKLLSQSDRSTTFFYSGYMYSGGAHGIGIDYGVTFRNSDGVMFTMSDIDTSSPDFTRALTQGLMKYFEVSSFDELVSNLMIGEEIYSPSDIPLPTVDPWISGNKLVFTYTSYEIAPYSAGYPTAEIPLSVAKSFLTSNGKTFID